MKILALLVLLAAACTTDPTRAGADISPLAQWASEVQQRIHDNWVRPVGSSEIKRCLIYLKVSPNGTVESAEFKEPCGDTTFEESVRTTIQRSSPLPLPSDPAVFQRNMVLNFQVR